MSSKYCFAIDRGGTFTDVYARCPNGKVRVMKLLSEDPANYKDAPTEGIRRILEQEIGKKLPKNEIIPTENIDWIRMGTTVATNALLERKGERMGLAITSGFRDLLYIGNQSRPNIFDLEIVCPDVLYEDVIEVEERIIPQQDVTEGEAMNNQWKVARSTTREGVLITKVLDEQKLQKDLKKLLNKGIGSLAVVLMHSYMYLEHEKRVGEIALALGFTHVSLSSVVIPMVKAVPRGLTACSDAYLTPCIKKYLKGFRSGFKDNLKGVNVLFMQSDGGLTQMDSFIGSRAILSGPAGGVVGYAMTTYKQFNKEPVIGFDMGGTSTDVSRFAGTYEHVFESTTAGVSIQAPQLDVNTVAAGGGSRLFFRSGMFVVGPDSAGAHPGPVCYRKNGYLAVTDANLALGRLLPQYFPKIFGPNEDEPLDKEGTLRAFQELTDEINTFREGADIMSLEEVAMGFVEVANEAMCRPIRALTQAKGHDTSQHILSVFGGAGAQHACAIARALGMHKVFVHKYAGILSAFGMALADVVHEVQEPCARRYETKNYPYIEERITALKEKCIETLQSKGFKRIEYELYLHMRYKGTDCALMCTPLESTSQDHGKKFAYGDFKGAFLERYKNEFGFIIDDRPIIIDDIRVRGIGKSSVDVTEGCRPASGDPPVELETLVYFHGGYQSTKVYKLSNLCAGHIIPGPAIIKDQLSTILIEPDCHATITKQGDISIDVGSGPKFKVGKELDAIQLSIFSHRFMSLAEQMGRILQRTSISTNIKERLDFSCALFGPDGGLVSNAPHIPVHLGAMQEAVQYQRKVLGHKLQEGDVLLSNHPTAGGSHLPDLTVITPVFRKGRSADGPIFYVASRGHHADIGGITPGSMPPHSTSIHQEGAVFKSFKLVDRGVFKEEALIDALMAPGKIPGSSGTRNLHDNLSDLRAQVAANQKGIVLVNELIDYYGLDVVQAYMNHIQESAEMAVKELLKVVSKRTLGEDGLVNLKAKEFMDDGSEICLNVCINSEEGTAVFDFSGTSHEVWGNCNAPRAITMSAIIYCLRCMVGYDVPLNQGCLNPIEIKIPPGSILAPSDEAAVVGGNVQTSQRVVDVILKAFKACAASQGCMNNVTFGDKDVGYYETVAGGAGAGPTWHGRSGIHSHMTNTRITDPEILEKRYPVVLQKFTLRRGTGGSGKYRGGEGVIRQLMFRRLLTMSILTERRVFAPYGMEGGECGAKGENYLVRRNGRIIRLPSKTSVDVEKGDVFLLQTPGGGGYGMVHDAPYELCIESPNKRQKHIERGSVYDFNKAQESV